MDITILGSYGGFPAKNDNCVAFLVKTQKANILVECGSGIARELQNYIDVSELDAIIVSHMHHDHYSDLGVFGYAYQVGMKFSDMKPLNVYLPASPSDRYNQLQGDEFVLHPITESESITIKDVTISFKRTLHDKETYAMVFEDGERRIGYTADTGYLPELGTFLKGCETIIGESSLLNKQKGNSINHMTTSEVVKIAEEANAKVLILTHFWYQIPKSQYFDEACAAKKTNMVIMTPSCGTIV